MKHSPIKLGNNIFVRTVTYFYTGEVVELSPDEIVLKKAAWIAVTGRFANSMKDGTFSEVEPYPDDMPVTIARGAMVDASAWPHPLPREQK